MRKDYWDFTPITLVQGWLQYLGGKDLAVVEVHFSFSENIFLIVTEGCLVSVSAVTIKFCKVLRLHCYVYVIFVVLLNCIACTKIIKMGKELCSRHEEKWGTCRRRSHICPELWLLLCLVKGHQLLRLDGAPSEAHTFSCCLHTHSSTLHESADCDAYNMLKVWPAVSSFTWYVK